MTMRLLPLAFILALVVATPAAAKPREVRIGDDFFVRKGSEPTVKVVKGKVVKWVWTGTRQHNVVVQDGPVIFQSDLMRSGSFKRKMKRPGTYKIICSIHAPDMAMTLRVRKP
jgi:plastocyanin